MMRALIGDVGSGTRCWRHGGASIGRHRSGEGGLGRERHRRRRVEAHRRGRSGLSGTSGAVCDSARLRELQTTADDANNQIKVRRTSPCFIASWSVERTQVAAALLRGTASVSAHQQPSTSCGRLLCYRGLLLLLPPLECGYESNRRIVIRDVRIAALLALQARRDLMLGPSSRCWRGHVLSW